jgi:hypothetical protein
MVIACALVQKSPHLLSPSLLVASYNTTGLLSVPTVTQHQPHNCSLSKNHFKCLERQDTSK